MFEPFSFDTSVMSDIATEALQESGTWNNTKQLLEANFGISNVSSKDAVILAKVNYLNVMSASALIEAMYI